MTEWESETTGMMAEEEPAMAEEERAPSLLVAEEREVEPTFSGEAMPEAAAEPCVVPVEDECVDGSQLVVNLSLIHISEPTRPY